MAASYSSAQRTEALRLYAERGPAEAARATGIPAATIRSWAKRSGAQPLRSEKGRAAVEASRLSWEQRRAELTVRLGEVAAGLLERAAASGDAQKAKALMVALAVAIDKAELLSGRATVREERPLVAVTPEEAQRELAALNDELQARDELGARQRTSLRTGRPGRRGRTLARCRLSRRLLKSADAALSGEVVSGRGKLLAVLLCFQGDRLVLRNESARRGVLSNGRPVAVVKQHSALTARVFLAEGVEPGTLHRVLGELVVLPNHVRNLDLPAG